jgi:hypothetical protein
MTGQRLHLPISGLEVCLQSMGGAEELLLSEAKVLDLQLALRLLSAIVWKANGDEISLSNLTLFDLDFLLLSLRKQLISDRIQADVTCSAAGCQARIEIAFGIEAYLNHYRPRRARGVEPAEEEGWFRLKNLAARFRLPTGADGVAIAHHPQPAAALIERCIHPSDLPARKRQRIERALEAMAPNLAQQLQGQCAECGAEIALWFDPQQFVLQELQNRSRFAYEEIHLLALYYQWSEAEILALPSSRRRYYAETIRQTQKSA